MIAIFHKDVLQNFLKGQYDSFRSQFFVCLDIFTDVIHCNIAVQNFMIET